MSNNHTLQTVSKDTKATTSEEISLEEEEILMESYPSHSSCCTFFPCFGRRPNSSQYVSTSSPSAWERLQQMAESEDKWWAGPLLGLKKMREWSEIIAGPRWKTFIRRFNRSGKNITTAKFHYDPMSYSLNFDEGQGHNGHLDDNGGNFPDFTSRFASVPSSCRSSMDLGKNGIPSC